MHNIYALAYFDQLMKRAANYVKGVKAKSRMIGYCRPGSAGSQRYGWTSTGDSEPTFAGLQTHTKGVLNLTMSGYSNVGYDIGGWMGVASDDVYTRWFEVGMFNPFAWAHGEGEHSPYIRPRDIMRICRTALERRYRLLPYVYSVNFESSQTGCPMLRTLPFETDCEPGTENINDEWFLGPSCGVATLKEWKDRMGPRARKFYHRFEQMIAACGKYYISPAKTRIAFLARVRFAGITSLTENGMTISFALPYALDSPRFVRISEVVPGWWAHRLRITEFGQLDKELQSWLRESYCLMGMQERLK